MSQALPQGGQSEALPAMLRPAPPCPVTRSLPRACYLLAKFAGQG
jgi:hypothetical protein